MMSINTITTTTMTNNDKKKRKICLYLSLALTHLGSGINFIVNFATNIIHTVLLFRCKSLFIKPVRPVSKAIYYTLLSSIRMPTVKEILKKQKDRLSVFIDQSNHNNGVVIGRGSKLTKSVIKELLSSAVSTIQPPEYVCVL